MWGRGRARQRGLSHVPFQSQTLLLTRRAGRHSFIFFAPNRSGAVCAFASVSVCSAHRQPRQTKRESGRSAVRSTAFNLARVCLAIVCPPHVGSDDNEVQVQMGFPRREAEKVAVYPPQQQSGRSLLMGGSPARKHWCDSFPSVASGGTWEPRPGEEPESPPGLHLPGFTDPLPPERITFISLSSCVSIHPKTVEKFDKKFRKNQHRKTKLLMETSTQTQISQKRFCYLRCNKNTFSHLRVT